MHDSLKVQSSDSILIQYYKNEQPNPEVESESDFSFPKPLQILWLFQILQAILGQLQMKNLF
jgi:hypothetical protein